MKRPVLYVPEPLSAPNREGIEANRARAARWCAWIASCGAAPEATWIVLTGVWDESKRELGLECDFALIERCDAVALCGARITPGMNREARHADKCGKPVIYLTSLGPEPPAEPWSLERLMSGGKNG